MKTSDEIQEMLNKVGEEVTNSIRGLLNNHFEGKYDFREFDEEFEDEANNEICIVDEKNVYFHDMGDELSEYPLGELGIQDAIYIIGLLEDRVKEGVEATK